LAININANMSLGAAEFLDAREGVETLDELLQLNTNIIPDGFEVYVKATDCRYKYNSTYSDPATGNWMPAIEMLPAGGTTGQVLTKLSNTDGDTGWTDVAGGSVGERLAIGTILSYTGAEAPMGYLLCDGQEVSRTDYADLFAVIGETYGAGDGTTTFNVPNLSDKFLQGVGTNALGTEMEAGLPNITASSGRSIYTGETGSPTGAFAFSTTSTKNYESSGSSTNRWAGMTLDASKSSAVYGNSDTVQPPALVVTFIIKATDYAAVPQNAIDDTAATASNVWSAQKVQAELDARTEIDDTTTSPDTVWSSEKTQAELDAKKTVFFVTADVTTGDTPTIENISSTYAEIMAASDGGENVILRMNMLEGGVTVGNYDAVLVIKKSDMVQFSCHFFNLDLSVYIFADETEDARIMFTQLATEEYVNSTAGVTYSLSGTTLTITSATP